MARHLNLKQQRFILEYLKDLNATKAAIRAGYSKNGAGQTAANLLKNTKINEEIRSKSEKIAEKLNINVDWVVTELVKLKESAKNEGVKLGAIEFLGKWQGMLKDKGDTPTTIVIVAPEIVRADPNG